MDRGAASLEARRRTRRERERAFRERLLLEAAEEVFAERGYAAATVEEVARRAGVAVQTLYNTFGSKEEVFAALVALRQDEFLDRMREAAAAPSARAALEAITAEAFRYFQKHRKAFRIYLGATHGFPWHIRSSLGERAYARHQAFLAVLEEPIRRGMASGLWPQDDAAGLAAAVAGLLNATLTQLHMADVEPDCGQAAARACRWALRMLGARCREGGA